MLSTNVCSSLVRQRSQNTEVHLLIQHIHQLLRQEAFDDSVLGNLIDSETITVLGYVFTPTDTASRHPITNHWTIDWDVATIIEALEEHKHLDLGSRWQQVVDNSISRVRDQSDRMEQVRSDTIYEWRSGTSTTGRTPRNLQPRILKSLTQSFTHRDNPYGNSNPNIAFQRDLDEALEADDEYRTNPSLPRLCQLLAELVYKWEKIDSQSRRMSGSTFSQSSDNKKKTSSSDRGRDQGRAHKPPQGTHCMGCNRPDHTREDCHFKDHPVFNHSSQWDGCRADRKLRARGKTDRDIKIVGKFRTVGTAMTRVAPVVSEAPSPYRRNDTCGATTRQ